MIAARARIQGLTNFQAEATLVYIQCTTGFGIIQQMIQPQTYLELVVHYIFIAHCCIEQTIDICSIAPKSQYNSLKKMHKCTSSFTIIYSYHSILSLSTRWNYQHEMKFLLTDAKVIGEFASVIFSQVTDIQEYTVLSVAPV